MRLHGWPPKANSTLGVVLSVAFMTGPVPVALSTGRSFGVAFRSAKVAPKPLFRGAQGDYAAVIDRSMLNSGRGMFAWQRDGIGPGQESITLIAYDEAGMSEVVGSLYEAVAGIDPLAQFRWPTADEIAPATTASVVPALKLQELMPLPDRVVGMRLEADTLTALSHDGTLLTDDFKEPFGDAKFVAGIEFAKLADDLKTPVNTAAVAAAQQQSDPTRLVKFVFAHGEQTAIIFWGGWLELRDASGKVLSRTALPQDITTAASNRESLVVGLADDRVFRLK
jgi:hypothetical protein